MNKRSFIAKAVVSLVAMMILGHAVMRISAHVTNGTVAVMAENLSAEQARQATRHLGLVEHEDAEGNKMYSGVSADPAKQNEMLEDMMAEWISPTGEKIQ